MKNICIDDRLKNVANLVDKCDIIADVGTDHGYLPIYLIQQNIVNKAYASDVAINPLNSAIENIKNNQLDDKITTILCDGLSKIPSDANCIIIAGMGGNLMIDILKNRNYDYDTYILQANLHHYALRQYLSNNNFIIIDEKVCYAHKKYYEIIKVKHGHQVLNELQLTFGPVNLIKKEKFFIDKWKEIKNKLEKVLVNFQGNENEKNKLTNEINMINEVITN